MKTKTNTEKNINQEITKHYVHWSAKKGYRVLTKIHLNMKNILEVFETRDEAMRYIALQFLLDA